MKKVITRIISFISFALVAIEAFNKISLYFVNKKTRVTPIVDKTYTWRFGDIKYMEKGKGTPLLLLHSMTPGSSSLEWKSVVNTLAEKYHVYTLDLPGFGVSDKKIKTYTNYIFVSAVCDFISDIIKEKTTIVTSGESACIGLISGYQRKNLFDKIIFVNPDSMRTFNISPDKNSKMIKKLYSLPIVGTLLYLIDMRKDDNDDYLFSGQYDGENARYYYASYFGFYVNFPVHHIIDKVEVPLLIITGNDYNALHKMTLEYGDYLDSWYDIEECFQFPHLEKPEAFCDALDTLFQYDYNDK